MMIKRKLGLIKKNAAGIILFIFWFVITLFNLSGYWMLVDDGEGIVFARTLFEKISSLNLIGFFDQILETNGRLRPVYWLYQMTVWFFGRNSYEFHHFAHMVVIGAGMVSVYLIVKLLTKSKMIPFFASLFFLLTPLNTENIFRLGPQEPLLVVLFGIMFYLMINSNKLYLPSIILVSAIFTKETSIALFPLILIYFIFGRKNTQIKNKKQSYYLLLTICISALVMVVATLLRRSGYSTNYTFNPQMIFENFVIYYGDLVNNTIYLFPIIPAIYIVRQILILFQKKPVLSTRSELFQFMFFVGFLLFLSIQLPWKYALVRYLMPAGFFLTVFSFIEIYYLIKIVNKINFVKKRQRILGLILVLFTFYVFFVMALNLIFKTVGTISNFSAFKRMSSYPKNTILLMNMRKADSTIELVYETGVHLSEFWDRGDIKVDYLVLQNLPKDRYIIVDTDQFPRAITREELNNMFNNKFTYLENKNRTLILTTPIELIKQTTKKIIQYFAFKKPITSEGIYTYYYNNSSWYFYNE